MTLFDRIWHYLTPFAIIWGYLTAYDTIWYYLALSGTIWHNQTLSFNIFQYLALSSIIWQYLALSWNIFHYLAISRNIWHHLALADTSWHYLTRSETIQYYLEMLLFSSNFFGCYLLRGAVKKNKKTVYLKTSSKKEGGEVNPMSKIGKEMNFWQKLEREGVTKHIVKNRSTLFCMSTAFYLVSPSVAMGHK